MHTFTTPTPPQLTIEFGAGSIQLDAGDTDETTVDLHGVRDDAATAELLAKTVVTQRGDAVVVLVPRHGRRHGRSPELALRVTAPHDTQLKIGASSADLAAAGRWGTSVVDTGSGDVRIAEASDSVRVRSGSGGVEIGEIAGDVDVKTGSGDVRIAAVAGAATLQSGSGDVTLDDGGDALRVNTGSGDVSIANGPTEIEATTGSGNVAVDRVERGDVRVRAASGDVRIGVADGTSAWLDVTTISGRARSDLDSAAAPDGEQVRLHLTTVSGDIDVIRA